MDALVKIVAGPLYDSDNVLAVQAEVQANNGRKWQLGLNKSHHPVLMWVGLVRIKLIGVRIVDLLDIENKKLLGHVIKE